jgi:hemerythrin superfamily protein
MPAASKSPARSKSAKAAKSKSSETSESSGKSGASTKPAPLADAEGADAVALLERDHREVEALFAAFEQADGDAAQRGIAIAICSALKVHARLEEDLFYPAASRVVEADLVQEAQVEHASAKDLISQIEMGAPGEAFFAARVKVLSEYIAHHVAEEEGEMFPKCRDSKLDLVALGRQIALRKQELTLGLVVSNPVLGLS